MSRFQFLLPLLVSFFASPMIPAQSGDSLSGDLIIFHAGSLAVPFKQLAVAFRKEHPAVKVLLESAGSVASARKITDLYRPCDILASSDYTVIEKMLIPRFADRNILIATNEMVIAYTEKSTFAGTINSSNWPDVLLDPEVRYGRSDPNSDPCGYRTVMTLQLAGRFYHLPGLEEKLLVKDQRYIRPKEVDLLALLESRTIDYIFTYKSVARQHHLRYLLLPDEINLKSQVFAGEYAIASVEINGEKPGDKMVIRGEPMVYSATILREAPNRQAAEAFIQFLLDPDKGIKILEANGQQTIIRK